MSECLHRKAHSAKVNVIYLDDADRFMAEVTIVCADCGRAFRFGGLYGGWSAYQPMVSADKTEARLPIYPPKDQPSEPKGEGERG